MTGLDELTTPSPNAANIVWLPFFSDENRKLIHSKLRGPNPRNCDIREVRHVLNRSYRDSASRSTYGSHGEAVLSA